jgi:hypothetical protein
MLRVFRVLGCRLVELRVYGVGFKVRVRVRVRVRIRVRVRVQVESVGRRV